MAYLFHSALKWRQVMYVFYLVLTLKVCFFKIPALYPPDFSSCSFNVSRLLVLCPYVFGDSSFTQSKSNFPTGAIKYTSKSLYPHNGYRIFFFFFLQIKYLSPSFSLSKSHLWVRRNNNHSTHSGDNSKFREQITSLLSERSHLDKQTEGERMWAPM